VLADVKLEQLFAERRLMKVCVVENVRGVDVDNTTIIFIDFNVHQHSRR
jgi:hypothetical protein